VSRFEELIRDFNVVDRYRQEKTSMRNIAAAAKKRLFAFVTIIIFIQWSHAEDFFFDSAGVKIHYSVEGISRSW
jgi:hypothetical protein